MTLRFEWDAATDRGNQRKHGLYFSEAKQLFEDPKDYLEIFDATLSDIEDRFIAIGAIRRGVVVVVYTQRDEDLVRIIGARFATRREQEQLRKYLDQYK